MNSKKTAKGAKYGVWAGLLLCASMTAYAQNPVTFQVDMGVKTAEGQFNPSVDVVEARGAFNTWSGGFMLTNSPANTNIYQGTFDVPGAGGETIEYKFLYITPAPATTWEDDPNRSFVLQSGGQILPVVYFNRDSVANTNTKAAVLFQVDMSVQVTAGNFDKNTEQVYARGNKMGWDPPPQGFQLFEDPSRPCIYTNTYTMENQLTGEQFFYKYTIWRPTAPPMEQTTWEDGPNKVLVWDGTEPTDSDGYHLKTLGPSYFNGVRPGDILSDDTLVTFRVDMNNAQTYPGAVPFDASTEGVWINGSFIPWWGWASMPVDYQMFDDQTHGDETAGDKIYSWQRLFLQGQPSRLEYKYGIQSSDNEAGFATNHVRFIRAVGTYVLPIDIFGVALQEPAVGSLAISPVSGGNVTVTWNGRPGVHLQCATNLTNPAWLDVANTDGQSLKVVPAGGGSKFFRLVTP